MLENDINNRYYIATDRLRDAAKWMFGIFTALGATVMSGTQLSTLGKIRAEDSSRIVVAILSGLITSFLILLIVGYAISVIVAGETDLKSISESKYKKEMQYIIDSGLLSKYNDKLEEFSNTSEDKNKDLYQNTLLSILLASRYFRVRRQFKVARCVMLIGSFIVSISLVIFIWAINPVENKVEASEYIVPVQAKITLNTSGKETLGSTLGKECIKHEISVVMLSYKSNSADILSNPSNQCKLARFTFKSNYGGLNAIPDPDINKHVAKKMTIN